MSLVRWDPFNDFNALFNRMMPAAFRWPSFAPDSDGETKFEWSPSADISETDKEYLIRAELPAVRKEDVKVLVEGRMITISGERRQQEENRNEKVHRVETFRGRFQRSFWLPEDADAESIRCEHKDGVLTVHIAKKPSEKPRSRQIEVE